VKFIHDVGTTALTRICGFVLMVIAGAVVSRALQPAGKGIYSSVLTFVSMSVMFGALGIGKAAIYHIGRKSAPVPSIAQTVFSTALINGVLVAGLSLLAGRLVQAKILPQIPDSALLLAPLLSFFGIVNSYLEGLLRGIERIFRCNLAVLLQAVSFLAFLLIAMVTFPFTLTPSLTLCVYLASQVVAGVMLFVSVRHLGLRWNFVIDWPLLRQMLAYGLVYQLYAFLQEAHFRLDIFIVGYFLGAADAGLYSNGVAIAEVIYNIPLAVSLVLVPWVANRGVNDAYYGVAQVNRILLMLMVPVAVLIEVVAPLIVYVLYGESFLASVAPLRMLVPGVIMKAVLLTIGAYLIGRGKLWTLNAIAVSAVMLNVLLNLLFIPMWGIIGAAAASTVTYSGACVLAAIVFLKERGVSFLALLPTKADAMLLAGRVIEGIRAVRAEAKL
jgi:O-antigen/teichoic acid export membrane protein